MTEERRSAIENIISDMETLNDLWWKSEEDGDKDAKKEHDALELTIRANMTAIGLNFDHIGAEYEDMIDKLKEMLN